MVEDEINEDFFKDKELKLCVKCYTMKWFKKGLDIHMCKRCIERMKNA